MPSTFANKVVMITGAGGALARSVIERFAAEGAKLVLVDRSDKALEEAVLANAHVLHEYMTTSGDIGNEGEFDIIVRSAEARFGQIDVLAHIAGGFAAGKPVHEEEIATLEKMLYLNATLTWVVCGRVAQSMLEKQVRGAIVVVLARSGLKGAKHMAAYTASKAAAERIMQSMAAELLDVGIRVNGVMPSTIDTPANRRDMPNADFSKWVAPAQLAEAIAFLASEAASAISGESLAVYHRA